MQAQRANQHAVLIPIRLGLSVLDSRRIGSCFYFISGNGASLCRKQDATSASSADGHSHFFIFSGNSARACLRSPIPL